MRILVVITFGGLTIEGMPGLNIVILSSMFLFSFHEIVLFAVANTVV
jgi:hypothetical protein